MADCSNLEILRISRPACLALVASACEVFPKECMGTLCCLELPNRSGKAMAAFPFQIADRAMSWVDSKSYEFFRKMLSCGPWNILCHYHSHTQRNWREVTICEPSEMDLDTLTEGDLEVIVRVSRIRKTKKNKWVENPSGKLSISWGRFQFLIGGFVRLEGNEDGDYRQIELRFG
jgi:proteasome lid subunit RPN8/RPN11